MGSLGLLMLAVVLGITGTAWSTHGSGISPRTGAVATSGAPDSRAAEPPVVAQASAGIDDSASRTTPSRGMDAGLLPQHVRLLTAAVLLTALPNGSQPYWVTVLGLGLCLWAAAGRTRLRPRCAGGSRHGTRAPPVRF